MSEESAAVEAAPEVIESEAVEVEGSEEIADSGESELLGESELNSEDVAELQAELVRTLNLKVDGEDFTEELPFDATPEMVEYLTKQAQLAKMSNKRAQESAELRKVDIQRNQDIQTFMEAIKSDPARMLKELGIDAKEFSEEFLEKEVELMQLTDEQRETLALKEELKDIKDREAKAELANKERDQVALRDKYAAEYEKEILSALDDNQLSNNPELILRMKDYMKTALENGIDLSFADVIPLVMEGVNNDITKLLGTKSVEELIKMLGEDSVKGIRNAGRKKKIIPPSANSIQDTGNGSKIKKPKVKINMNDFFNNL